MMTLSAIDQALNVALTGIVYGSITWIACAFGTFVVTQQRKRRTSSKAALLPARKLPLLAPASVPLLQTEPVSESVPAPVSAGIEIIIEQPLLVAAEGQAVLPETVKPATVQQKAEQSKIKPKVNRARSPLPNSQVTLPVIKDTHNPTKTLPEKAEQPTPIEITCEPVNWKKWRVADLRKASIARVCGVRTRPIGSKRNLPKADLIAQYEQQLKRMTKPAPKRAIATEATATITTEEVA